MIRIPAQIQKKMQTGISLLTARRFSVLLFMLVMVAGVQSAYAALPDAPTSVTARAGNATALVRWMAPVNTSGLLVTGYTATATPGGATCTSSAGSPATPSCTINGLTNGTLYTFQVTATTADGTSVPSLASAAATPLSGTENVNLIGSYGSIKWGANYIGALESGAMKPFPSSIYNNGSYSSTPQDTLFAAANVNSNASTLENCTSSWMPTQILCDPSVSGQVSPGKDSPAYLWKQNANAGLTIDSTPAISGYVVIDLGAVRNFTTLRVFQMFSDGKTTDVAMSASSNTSATWPVYNDGTWTTIVPKSPVGAGATSNSFVTCPSAYDFSATSGRYVKLEFWNGGQFGNPSWIEVSAAKLFFENTVFTPGAGCPPEPPTNPSASAGNAVATVAWTPPSGTVTGFQLQQSTNGGSSWSAATTSPVTIDGSATSALVTGLSNGTAYVFRVLATNASGTSPYSSQTSAVTPVATLPNPPSGVTATAGNASVVVSWSASSGATSYQVTGLPSGSCSATAPDTTCTVTGLTNGLSYTFTVTATSAGGASGASNATAAVTPQVPPSPSITTEPASARVAPASTVSFTVAATGANLTYQWQVNSGSGFNNIVNSGVYSGADTAELTITGATVGMDGYTYRVVVTGSTSPAATSNVVSLTVSAASFPITSGNWASPWSAPGGNATKSGATLTLTTATGGQKGYIFFTDAFSASLGINAIFDYYSGGGNGADGLTFFLIDGSQSPTSPGASGGSLGYSKSTVSATDGLVGGWVGIGFDEYGNFSASPTGTASAQSITIRGQIPNFAYITKGKPSFNIDGGNRKVNLTVDKTQHITVQISNNNGATWETPINNVSLGQTAPANFKLGFAAGTGGSTNTHQVSNVVVTIPGDDSITASGLATGANTGSTVNFTLRICPLNTTVLQKDIGAMISITGSGLIPSQLSYGPYDLGGGSCVDVPASATITATSNQAYSYTAMVSSSDAGFGDVNLSNNTASQSGLVPPNYTAGTSISGSGSASPTSQSVANGSAATITFTASTGYHLQSIDTGCNGAGYSPGYTIGTAGLASHSYTTGTNSGNCTVGATFAVNQFDVIATPDAHSYVTGYALNTPHVYTSNYNTSNSVTFAADTGYHLTGITSSCGGTATAAYSNAVNGPWTTTAPFTASGIITNGVAPNCGIFATSTINVYSITPSVAVVP